MVLQREKHEVVVEIVLPQKQFGIIRIGSKAHVTWQAIAIDFHKTSINTLQRDDTTATIDDAELCLFTPVVSMRVVE